MPYLADAAVILSLLNLVFTFAVIRRLRQHTNLLSRRANDQDEDPVMIGPGETPGQFAAAAVDGSTIATGDTESGLVAFLSPGCSLCHEQLPEFVEYASRFPGGRSAAVAVVLGHDDESKELAAKIEPVARVVHEEHGGTLATSFGVKGYPAFAVLDGGVVRASGFRVDQLPLSVAA